MKNDSPIIISRKRKKKKHAHHGGTWKIAYADFMTAMMAFFLVMWLISQSSTVQREMIADYFRMPLKPSMANGDKTSLSDSIIPGGGDDLMKQDGEVANHKRVQSERQRWMESLKQARDKLQQMIETDPRLNNFKSNIMLRLTNDGLLIQITDSQDRPMFRVGSELPESYMNGILQALVPLLQELPNKISLTGHTDSLPYAGGTSGYSNWELSSGRANAARRVLVKAGLDDERFLRVIGTGSRMPLENSDPSSPANRRISILVLSKTKEQDIRLEDTRMHRPENVLNNTTQQEVRGITMDMNDFTEIFFTEAEELLAEMEKHLLEIDAASPNPEQVNAIFRAAHSLKGGQGLLALMPCKRPRIYLRTCLTRCEPENARLTERPLIYFWNVKTLCKRNWKPISLRRNLMKRVIAIFVKPCARLLWKTNMPRRQSSCKTKPRRSRGQLMVSFYSA